MILRWLLLTCGTSYLPSFADASTHSDANQHEGKPIASIHIIGQRRVEKAAIKRRIRLYRRRTIHMPTVRKDVRRIYRLGRFQSVLVELVKQRKGRYAVIYRVKEHPMVRRVRFIGYKEIGKDDIKKVVDVRQYAILNKVKIKQNAEKIRHYYQTQGYHFARVETLLSKPKQATVDVTFKITENAKMRIRKIYFVGNKAIKDSDLKSVLYSQEFHLLSWINGRSLYRQAMVERDVMLLQSYYLDRGHIDAHISRPKIQLSKDRKAILLTFRVREGPRFRYGKIKLKGDLLWSRKYIRRRLQIKRGQYFHRTRLYRDNIMRLQTMYQNRGYAYVNVIPRFKRLPQRKRLDISFHIQKGRRIRIERIEIIGNGTTRDSVIRRHIKVKEGDYYHGSKVELSQRRIFALGYFAKTHPRYGVKVVSRRGSRPDRMILRFVVKEKPSGNVRFGIGFAAISGFNITTSVSKQNIFGWGKFVSLNLQLALAAQQIQFRYFDPNFFGTDLNVGVSFYHLMNQISPFASISFGEMRTGGTLTLGYPILDQLNVSLTYKAERIGRNPLVGDITQGTLLARTLFGGDEATFTSSLTLDLQLDLRNNRLNPTSGSYHRASVEAADSFLGSQNRYYRFSLVNRFYAELPLGITFKVNSELGMVVSPSDQPVPFFMRYRLGGARTIRGYNELSIGPRKTIATGALDTTELNWGGNKQILLNAELEFPIVPKIGLRGVAFFDAGNTYSDNEMFFQDLRNPDLPLGLFMSAGFGLRWKSPVGLLRFEFGFPLTRRPQDEIFRFHFSMGRSF